MNGCGRYDADLQMFVEQPREPDLRLLRFLRWLAKRGQLEQRPLSRPQGRYAGRAAAVASPRIRPGPRAPH